MIGIRLYALYQVSQGKPSRGLEELYNTSFKQITNWVHQFEKEGIEGLLDNGDQGRKAKLQPLHKEKTGHLLGEESPEAHWYNTAT